MKKSREIVGLPVVDLLAGSSVGRVHSLIIDPQTRHVAALEVGERTLLKTNIELIPFSQLRNIGNDAITVISTETSSQSDKAATLENLAENQLSGTRVVTVDGTFAGTVEDFSFSPTDGKLAELFIIQEKPRSHLACPVTVVETFGRDFIVVNENYQTAVRKIIPPHPNNTPQHLVQTLESKAIDFALGREVRQEVLGENGDLIIRQGEAVTAENIALAREKNRLPQLLFAAGVGELLDGLDFTREKLDAGSKKIMDAWQNLRGRSQVWLSRKLDDDLGSTTTELRDLWQQVQGKLSQSGRELEDATRKQVRSYVLGKTLANPVYDPEGTLLGGRGDLVTEEMRSKAETAGRLPQLFLSATTGDVQNVLEPIKKQIRNMLRE
ncbi:MAG TPA: PRC-barrel domain-containing protein [Oscillospiraceae bacterium]|nr:PRC-barrel domain-containing protein [Oscillospiraceae bacterium]